MGLAVLGCSSQRGQGWGWHGAQHILLAKAWKPLPVLGWDAETPPGNLPLSPTGLRQVGFDLGFDLGFERSPPG